MSASATQPANASAKTLFEVITAYGNYPSFNPSVAGVAVLRKAESGAEFIAGRTAKIGKRAHAFDRYEVDGGVFGVERTRHGI